ncbi:MAG: glycosyltransferase [Clostridia bacterium]|nr:glycosyltransferase [Clostridia bacterium]
MEKGLNTPRFFALAVVHNVFCGQSITCQRLSEISDACPEVLIYDNSDGETDRNREFCRQKGWVYLGGGGNRGLSVAYNAAAAYAAEKDPQSWLCIFDDDTDLPRDYFSCLEKAVQKGGCSLYAPLIFSGGRLISPCRFNRKNWKTGLISSTEEALSLAGTEISAINSGLAVKTELFKTYRYDENVFLDGIDHKFIGEMQALGQKLGVLDCTLDHGFSGDQKPSAADAAKRFAIYAADTRYIHRRRKGVFLRLAGKRAAHLTLIYKRPLFLRIFLGCVVGSCGKKNLPPKN